MGREREREREMCIYIYIYIHTHTYVHRRPKLGAKYCTPEIVTSEIIVDFRWHVPMDVFSGIFQRHLTCQWYFAKDCHFSSGLVLQLSNGISVVFSNGIYLSVVCSTGWPLFRWTFNGIDPMDFQWHFPYIYRYIINLCEIWCVIFCPDF